MSLGTDDAGISEEVMAVVQMDVRAPNMDDRGTTKSVMVTPHTQRKLSLKKTRRHLPVKIESKVVDGVGMLGVYKLSCTGFRYYTLLHKTLNGLASS